MTISDDALIAYMEEHYAHARDHEHLRSQITSVLSAGAFVLMGVTLDGGNSETDSVPGRVQVAVGCVAIAMGLLNFHLNRLHVRRFDAHAAAASTIRTKLLASPTPAASDYEKIAKVARAAFEDVKARGKAKSTGSWSLSLAASWQLVPLTVCVAGALLIAYGLSR